MTHFIVGWKSETDEKSFRFEGETAEDESLRFLVSELEWSAGDLPPDDQIGKDLWVQAYKTNLFGRTTSQEFEIGGVMYWRKKLV